MEFLRLFLRLSFRGETSSGVAKCRFFHRMTICHKYFRLQAIWKLDCWRLCVVFYKTVWLRSSLGVRREENLFSSTSLTLPSPGDLTLGRTRGGESWMQAPLRFFWVFFLENKTSAPDVFSGCSFIPCAHFKTSLVMVSSYGFEICRNK